MEDKIIGVGFRIDNNYDTFLDKILKGIDIQKYKWYVRVSEIIPESNKNGNLFNIGIYTGKEFAEKIKEDNYYIIFGEFLAYYPKEEVDEDIDTYEDYATGRCQIIVLVYDAYYFDIYCKDEENVKIIERNCIENHYTEIEPFTEKNNPRTKMWV